MSLTLLSPMEDSKRHHRTMSRLVLLSTLQNPMCGIYYVKTYGDQGITGFLELTGAKKSAGSSDFVQWYEEGRLHKTVAYTAVVAAAADTSNAEVTCDNTLARVNDVLLLATGQRVVITGLISTTGFEVMTMDGSTLTSSDVDGVAAIIGNVYGQGTEQPTAFYQAGLTLRTNPYIITKEMYEVNGSQATNIGWLNVNGQYMWYLKNEMDTRKRFMNQREMMLLYSQLGPAGSPALIDLAGDATDATVTNVAGNVGSEGYFSAVEKRGITTSGAFGDAATPITDIDTIILALDKEGAPSEYAMYVNRQTSLDVDDMLASGLGATSGGLTSQFGAFNNSQDMAVSLGFKSFTRGGYTFHKHDWKLLNDATLGGLGKFYKGAMIPMSQVADAKSGVKSPSLEMNYKSAGNYSREMEHWVEGGGVLGHVTSGKDTVKFNYRSECNLVTRAANQHVVIK
jgi:hypothetical protein